MSAVETQYTPRSGTLRGCYKSWQNQATPEQIELVDAIYLVCEQNYEAGGDVIVECRTPEELLDDDDWFVSVEMWVEQHLNTRPGEDSDWQLGMYDRMTEWKKQRAADNG